MDTEATAKVEPAIAQWKATFNTCALERKRLQESSGAVSALCVGLIEAFGERNDARPSNDNLEECDSQRFSEIMRTRKVDFSQATRTHTM